MLSCLKFRTTHLIFKTIIFGVGMTLIHSGNAIYANEFAKNHGEETQVTKKSIEQVLEEHTDYLMSLSGVVGTGQGLCSGKPCIKVFVSKKTAKLEKKIPKNLEGYPVVIQETGRYRALPDK